MDILGVVFWISTGALFVLLNGLFGAPRRLRWLPDEWREAPRKDVNPTRGAVRARGRPAHPGGRSQGTSQEA